MPSKHITVSVKLAWWAIPYLRTLAWLCVWLDMEPNMERVNSVLSRALRTEVKAA